MRPPCRYQVAVDGKTFLVEVHDTPAGRIVIDGRELVVDARAMRDGAWSFLQRQAGLDEPGFDTAPARARVVHVDGPLAKLSIQVEHPDGEPRAVTAQVSVPRAEAGGPRAGESTSTTATGPVTVRAPIPGKIAKIAIGLGERVKSGQALLVLEAMKMENEIRAPSDGKVASILVREGQSVDAGHDLISLVS